MKICPKCNELLGDAVKVCFNCKYRFDPKKLQEYLDQKEKLRQIAYERVQKKNKMIFHIVLGVFLGITIFSLIFGWQIYQGNGRYVVTGCLLMPYEYIVTPDYVELCKYYGGAKEVDIPDTLWGRPVTRIGAHCFDSNNMIKVNLPKTVTAIDNAAFYRCTSLVEVTGGENVQIVDKCAFQHCTALTTLDIGANVKYIGYEAFADCVQLKRFELPNGFCEICHGAFANSGLEEFEFRDVRLGDDVFLNTPWLAEETFLISHYNDLVSYNGPEGRIEIPDVVETIRTECFVGLNDSEIFIPWSVEYIDGRCFMDCSNIKIYIPSSVEKMRVSMENCSEVTIVTTEGSRAEEFAKEEKIPYEIVESW